jgi:hypothetical protein
MLKDKACTNMIAMSVLRKEVSNAYLKTIGPTLFAVSQMSVTLPFSARMQKTCFTARPQIQFKTLICAASFALFSESFAQALNQTLKYIWIKIQVGKIEPTRGQTMSYFQMLRLKTGIASTESLLK